MLRVSCGAPGTSASVALATERPQNALPLTASCRTAFVFATAASAPLLQRPRALENATHEVLCGAELQDPAQIPLLTEPDSQHEGRAAIAGMLPEGQ
jgi:hypothetical protein